MLGTVPPAKLPDPDNAADTALHDSFRAVVFDPKISHFGEGALDYTFVLYPAGSDDAVYADSPVTVSKDYTHKRDESAAVHTVTQYIYRASTEGVTSIAEEIPPPDEPYEGPFHALAVFSQHTSAETVAKGLMDTNDTYDISGLETPHTLFRKYVHEWVEPYLAFKQLGVDPTDLPARAEKWRRNKRNGNAEI